MSLKILYDGQCPLCYREIHHYLKKDPAGTLEGVDITSDLFKAENYGLTETAVNLELHAIDEDGRIHKAIDSFIEIWKRLPMPYPLWAKIVNTPGIRSLADFGYIIFAQHIRPRLPKRSCPDDSCQL